MIPRINVPRTGKSPQEVLRENMAAGLLQTPMQDAPVMPTQPTEQFVGEQVQQLGIPQVPPKARNIADLPMVSDMESLAQANKMPFVPTTEYSQPQYDEMGNVVRDEMGNPVLESVPMGAFAQEQQNALGRVQGVQDALAMTREEVMDPYAVAQGILGQSAANLANLDARINKKTNLSNDDAADRMAQRTAPLLDAIHNLTETQLFSMQDAHARDQETGAPIGVQVAVDEQWIDPSSPSFNDDLKVLKPLATVVGLSFYTAANQMSKSDPSDGMQKRVVAAANGTPIEDAMYMGDVTDAMTHSIRNAFDRLKIEAKPESINKLAMAKVLSAIKEGELIANLDSNNKWVLTASPDAKDKGRKLSYLTEALTGDPKRMLPTKTPQVGGSTFDKPGPSVSKNSRKAKGIVTAAADATKDILGRIGYMYKPKDVMAKQKELEDVFSEANVEKDPDTSAFWYSRSKFAKKNKLDKGTYDKAKRRVAPPKDAAEFDEASHNKRAHTEALKVMGEKQKTLQFDLMNAQGLMGSVRFQAWTHALSNQRFFPKSSGMNYMESKTGARDMLNVGLQDTARGGDLFDPIRVKALQEKGRSALLKKGWPRHDALVAMPNADLGAIGTMIDAVINYYTGVGPTLNRDVLKMPEAKLLEMYTPEIGQYLADLGSKYNAWLEGNQDMKMDDKEFIESHLAAMEPGESLGNKNLWDDLHTLYKAHKDPELAKSPVELTHLSFDDGNQNGIFLQSLFFGNNENSLRLGAFMPSLSDMRGFALDSFLEKISELTKDDPDAREGWSTLMDAMSKRDGSSQLASDLFKSPLMQNAYGKDASMFTEMVQDFFEAPKNDALVKQHLGMYSSSGNAAAVYEIAGAAVESTLRTIIDTANTSILKAIGRHAAITNTPLLVPGATGDTMFFTPVSTVQLYNDDTDTEVWKAPDGTLRKIRSEKTITMGQKDGPDVQLPEQAKVLDPAATKGRQYFWNSRKKKYDHFDNPLGSAQSRMGPVMLVQSLDGDLVKMTTLMANKGRKVPFPAMWVHDSIISSPGSALIYRNVYNNIAIPAAIPYMKEAAKRIATAWEEGKQKAFEDTQHMDAVGIGPEGEYPALGGYFDEVWERIQDNGAYKDVFMSRKHNNLAKWKQYQENMGMFLDEARAQGYRAPGDIGPSRGAAGVSSENDRRAHLAVTPAQFRKLVDIAAKGLQLEGPQGRMRSWLSSWPAKVDSNFRALQANSSIRAYGFAQMTPTGASSPISSKKEAPKAEDNNKQPSEDPFFSGGNIPKPVMAPGFVPRKKDYSDVPF